MNSIYANTRYDGLDLLITIVSCFLLYRLWCLCERLRAPERRNAYWKAPAHLQRADPMSHVALMAAGKAMQYPTHTRIHLQRTPISEKSMGAAHLALGAAIMPGLRSALVAAGEDQARRVYDEIAEAEHRLAEVPPDHPLRQSMARKHLIPGYVIWRMGDAPYDWQDSDGA